jgi:hypothetical protein
MLLIFPSEERLAEALDDAATELAQLAETARETASCAFQLFRFTF